MSTKTPNNFSVKSSMYPKKRERVVDGPWKPTVDEAVQAFAEMIKRKELAEVTVCNPFVAEKADEKTAGSKDVRGVYYNTNVQATKELTGKLLQAGLYVR
jgi:hypothetical protein